MSNRKINVNHLHFIMLRSIEWSYKVERGLAQEDYNDMLLYSSMLQSGVTRFNLIGGAPKQVRDSKFLSPKCTFLDGTEFELIYKDIEDSLRANEIHKGKPYDDIIHLALYLTELVYAARTKASVVEIIPPPDIKHFYGKLSPGIISAVESLMKCVEPAKLDLVIPRQDILLKDVSRFHELLESDLFDKYSASQEVLDTSGFEIKDAQKLISEKSRYLQSRYSNILDLQKITLNLAPVTTKLVDSFLGTFLGQASKLAESALVNAIKSNMRISIYKYGETHLAALRNHYSAIDDSKSNLTNRS